jgi:hypothetical protein
LLFTHFLSNFLYPKPLGGFFGVLFPQNPLPFGQTHSLRSRQVAFAFPGKLASPS